MCNKILVMVAVCGLTVSILATTLPALAGEEDDRVRDVEDNLVRMKDKLDSIASRSSSSEIDYAIEYSDKVKEYSEKLKSLPAQNEPGKTMASYYPDYVSKFKESAKNLKYMKDAQLKAENERLTERCNDAERNLRSEMQNYVDKKDPSGLSKIPDLADRMAREYGDPLKRMEETHREMDRWKGYARTFSESHGRWSDVRSKLSDGANDIWDRWNRRMEESRYKCQVLAKGKDSDPVREAMGKLGNFGQVRTVIRKKIDEKLQNTASKLRDLDSRSGDAASEIQDAQRSVDDVIGFLEELKNVQGEDSETKQIADRWPSQARSLKESIDAYKKLKAGQSFLDQDPQVCQSDLNDMGRFIAERTSTEGRKNKNGANEILNKGGETQKKWQGKKDEADKFGRTLETYKDKAASFSFREGEWARIVDSLQSSAGKSLAYYNKKRAEIYDSDPCRQLLLGASARDVDQALKALGEHKGTITARYRKLRENFVVFKSSATDFRATCEMTSKEIREAICNDEDWATKVPRIADSKISEFRGKWDRLQSERDKMLNEIDQLINDSKDQSLPVFKRRIVEYLNPLGPIVDNELKGAGNPKVRAYIDAGNQEHKSRQSSCDMKEVTLPNGKRLDCVKACTIIEIKPNNNGAVRKGKEQVAGYQKSLEDMYKSQGSAMFTGDFSHLKRCEQKNSDGTSSLVLKTDIETYNFCPDSYSVLLGPKEPLVDFVPQETIEP